MGCGLTTRHGQEGPRTVTRRIKANLSPLPYQFSFGVCFSFCLKKGNTPCGVRYRLRKLGWPSLTALVMLVTSLSVITYDFLIRSRLTSQHFSAERRKSVDAFSRARSIVIRPFQAPRLRRCARPLPSLVSTSLSCCLCFREFSSMRTHFRLRLLYAFYPPFMRRYGVTLRITELEIPSSEKS